MPNKGPKTFGVILLTCSMLFPARAQDFVRFTSAEQEKYGMPNAVERRLTDNDRKLKVSLSLDRSVYLSGEAAVATIVVENPTLTTLETHELFGGGLDDFRLMSGDKFVVGMDECCPKWPAGKTHILAAGEKIQRSFQSRGGARFFIIPNGCRACTLTYGFGNAVRAAADFSVIAAEVVAEGYAPLRNQGSRKREEDGKMVPVPMQATLAVLQAEGKYYVVASRGAGSKIVRDARYGVWEGISALGPYVRIAESDTPIVEVSGEEIVDNVNEAAPEVGKEKLRVRWKQADGKQSMVNLGADRRPVQW